MKVCRRSTPGAIVGIAFAAAATTAVAQSPPLGWFGYVEGRYAVEPSSGILHNDFPNHDNTVSFGDGWGGAARLGYRFRHLWDVALSGSFTDYSAGSTNSVCCNSRRTDGSLTTADVQLGYTVVGAPGLTARLFTGLRYVELSSDLNDPGNGYKHDGRSRGFGVVSGIEVTAPLAHRVNFVGGIEGSLLAGRVRDRITGSFNVSGTDDREFVQIGGHAGLSFALNPSTSFVAGYRLNNWIGIESEVALKSPSFTAGGGQADHLDHGPFVRLNIDLSGSKY